MSGPARREPCATPWKSMSPTEPKIEKHFTMILYPFQLDLSGRNRKRRLDALWDRWQPWWKRLETEEAVVRAIDDTYFFLPHIRTLLFPELQSLHPRTGGTTDITSAKIGDNVAEDAVMRLTLQPRHDDPLQQLRLLSKRPDQSDFHYDFRLEWGDVALFPQEVGLLIFKVSLIAPLETREVVEFLREARRIHPLRPDLSVAAWKSAPDLTFTARDLVDFYLQGLTDLKGDLDHSFASFLRRSNRDAPDAERPDRYSLMDAGEVYGEGFFRYSYACRPQVVEAAGAPSRNRSHDAGSLEDIQASRPPPLDPRHSHSDTLFENDETRILYQLATCTDLDHIDSRPHRQGLQHLLRQGHIAWWANWQGLALQSNVVFLGLHSSVPPSSRSKTDIWCFHTAHGPCLGKSPSSSTRH